MAYALSAIPAVGLVGIWWAIPMGWALADLIGYVKLKGIKVVSANNVQSSV